MNDSACPAIMQNRRKAQHAATLLRGCRKFAYAKLSSK